MENSMHGSCPAYVSEWSGGSPVQYAHSLVFDGNGRQRIFLEAGCFLRLSHGDAGPGYAAAQVPGHQAWRAVYEVKQPGVYQFALEPAPYFDPEKDRFIIHYTKTVVAAFGDEKGWDVPLGLKMEIIPLTRPFANYSGNIFQGRVLLDGKPVPGAEVEVEYYNRGEYCIKNVIMTYSS